MNTHLSEQAMLRWHTGEATEQECRHIAECSHCRESLAPMTAALRDFGAAARNWSPIQPAAPLRQHAPRRHWGRFALAAAAACLLLLATGLAALRWQHSHQPTQARMQPSAPAKAQLTTDDALLEAVDQDVSREVPEALQPLSLTTGTSKTTQQ